MNSNAREIETARRILTDENCSFVMIRDGVVRSSHQKGIRPLLDVMAEDVGLFEGASVADKVIGKAAAMILVHGKIKELYASVISEPAAGLIRENGISFGYGKIIPNILNRDGTDLCPLEKLCADTDDPEIALERFHSFFNR